MMMYTFRSYELASETRFSMFEFPATPLIRLGSVLRTKPCVFAHLRFASSPIPDSRDRMGMEERKNGWVRI